MRNELRELRGYAESLEYLSSFSKQGASVTDLTRFSALSERLGNPERGLRCIHVAGTNGKGSVTEYIASALAERYNAGRFSSPYIVDVRERIEINGGFIPKEDFTRLAERVRQAEERCENRAFSQFEILTAICFLYFAEQRTDYAVIEAGIGGTLDCTNVIPCPEAAVITSIGLDHTLILGDTEEKIAQSKSGIIKGGVCVAASGIPKAAMDVIERRCIETGARLTVPDKRELTVHSGDLRGSSFSYKGKKYTVKMCGAHQISNALTAIEVLNAATDLTYEEIAAGISKAALPARLELFSGRTPEIILDGGHNPQAMLAAKEVLLTDPREKTAVIGMISTKDYKTALEIILPCFKAAVFYDGFADNAVSARTLAELGEKAGITSCFTHDIRTALTIAFADDPELLFIGGSLYMAAEFRKLLTGEAYERN